MSTSPAVLGPDLERSTLHTGTLTYPKSVPPAACVERAAIHWHHRGYEMTTIRITPGANADTLVPEWHVTAELKECS